MKTIMIAAAAILAGGLASAQSTLMEPNNSAGSPLDTPPRLTQPQPSSEPPSRTDSALWAFETLDKKQRGYVTQSDIAVLPGQFSFYEADRNRDGRLDADEFQRFWDDYQSGSD